MSAPAYVVPGVRDADACDGCGAALEDVWVAVGTFGEPEDAACVCPPCAPIVQAIDRLVAGGHLDEHQAARRFEELRWGGGHARRDPRGAVVGFGDLPCLPGGGPGADRLPSSAVAPAPGT